MNIFLYIIDQSYFLGSEKDNYLRIGGSRCLFIFYSLHFLILQYCFRTNKIHFILSKRVYLDKRLQPATLTCWALKNITSVAKVASRWIQNEWHPEGGKSVVGQTSLHDVREFTPCIRFLHREEVPSQVNVNGVHAVLGPCLASASPSSLAPHPPNPSSPLSPRRLELHRSQRCRRHILLPPLRWPSLGWRRLQAG